MQPIEKIISNVKATLAIEGLKTTKFSEELGRLYLEGKITIEEAIDRVKLKYMR